MSTAVRLINDARVASLTNGDVGVEGGECSSPTFLAFTAWQGDVGCARGIEVGQDAGLNG